jgi:hypothetical protein
MRHHFCLLLAFVSLGIHAAIAGAGDDLAKTLKPITSADNYRFSVQTNAEAPAVDAKYQKGSPLYVQADKIEFFRHGEIMVYKQGDAWQRTRTGTLSDPLRILGASANVRAVRLPHEDLAEIAKGLMKVKTAEKTITGDLGADAAKKLAPVEDRDLARGATVKLWLDADGRLAKYEIAVRVQGKRGNAEVDGVVTRIVTIADIGKTKVEVPAGAKKALE